MLLHVNGVVSALAKFSPLWAVNGVLVHAGNNLFSFTQSILWGLAGAAGSFTLFLVWLLADPVSHRGVEADEVVGVAVSVNQVGAARRPAADLLGVVPHQLSVVKNQRE